MCENGLGQKIDILSKPIFTHIYNRLPKPIFTKAHFRLVCWTDFKLQTLNRARLRSKSRSSEVMSLLACKKDRKARRYIKNCYFSIKPVTNFKIRSHYALWEPAQPARTAGVHRLGRRVALRGDRRVKNSGSLVPHFRTWFPQRNGAHSLAKRNGIANRRRCNSQEPRELFNS